MLVDTCCSTVHIKLPSPYCDTTRISYDSVSCTEFKRFSSWSDELGYSPPKTEVQAELVGFFELFRTVVKILPVLLGHHSLESKAKFITSSQVWGHTTEQRFAASTLRRYSFRLRLAITQADARPVMPISFR